MVDVLRNASHLLTPGVAGRPQIFVTMVCTLLSLEHQNEGCLVMLGFLIAHLSTSCSFLACFRW
jgi:hypothetical protein